LGNLSLDSVHVSTSFLVDIMLLVATTRYKMSSLAAYGRAGGGGIWTARLGALLLLMHLLRSDSTDWPRSDTSTPRFTSPSNPAHWREGTHRCTLLSH